MKKPRTPFPTTGYFGPDYFCDREEELAQLIRNLKGGNSTTLVAMRRMGKTALIRHLFHQLGTRNQCIYLDILPAESLNDLLNQFIGACSGSIAETTSTGRKLWKFIRSLRPVMSYDALSGAPSISIRSNPEESRRSIEELFALLEQQPKQVIVAIDEFQQILNFPEKQVDAWLRSVIQQLTNVCFIFSGSQQHLMHALFRDPGKPFFRSTQFMKIGKIDQEVYAGFIKEKFHGAQKSIPDQTVSGMLRWTDCHTYYVQLLCNRVFLASGKRIDEGTWKEEAGKIIKEQEFVFYGYREMLTIPQWRLLRAIAREGEVYQPTSADFISRYSLGNPATVLRSLKSLQNKELVHQETGETGTSSYRLYDLLFRRWVEETPLSRDHPA